MHTEVVRSTDAAGVETNCFFGHVFNVGGGAPTSDGRGNTGTQLWNWVEGRWRTTYRAWPINDGTECGHGAEGGGVATAAAPAATARSSRACSCQRSWS